MATRLAPGKKVAREVHAALHGALVVTMTAEGLYLREKGRRTAFLLSWGSAYLIAGKAAATGRATLDAAPKAKRRVVTRVSRGLLTTGG